MIKNLFRPIGSFAVLAILGSLFSCSQATKQTSVSDLNLPPKPQPKEYICYRTPIPVTIDGIIDEDAWSAAAWTDFFQDIEGSAKPAPGLKTHAKLLWDDTNLYIAAEIEEPHVWATLKQRDTVIFYDNDFEVFIDPDGDTHAYYELEVNALGTAWDLLLLKPYRDGGPPVNGWDIAGLRVGTHINGTLNNPDDTDKGWTVELAIPLAALKECAKDASLPQPGDQWRIDFSRVEWRTVIENGNYRKEINPATGKPFPEDNWVWSPQGRINMHMPEMWGYLQFSALVAGKETDVWIPDVDFEIKWALRTVYYAEFEYYLKNGTYSSNFAEIGLDPMSFPKNMTVPVIQSTRTTFECSVPSVKGNSAWIIYQDGKIINLPDSFSVK